MDAECRLMAEQQQGLLLAKQVTERGTDPRTLRRWVADGELIRLCRGLYVLPTHRPERTEDRHLQLAHGGRLLMPDAVFSHWTALLAHDVPVLRVPKTVRLRRPVHRQIRRSCFVIDPLRGEPVASPHGPTTAVADAVLDQARLRGVEAGLVSADAALHAGLVSQEDLAARARRVKGSGSRLVRRTAELADGAIESVGESRLRYVCIVGGIAVVPQVTIRNREGEFVARVDFLVKDSTVILEFDGRVKYVDGARGTLWSEKQREDALRRLGYTVVRVTWDDLATPQVVLARIREAVAGHRSRAS